MKTLTFQAMGSKILIAMDSEDPQVIEEAQKARSWFEEWEESLSRFRINSEISRLNRQSGKPVKVSSVFMEISKLAIKAHQETNGLISPLVLNALEAAGYTETFENLANQADNGIGQNDFLFSNEEQEIILDETHHTIMIPSGTQMDFGGFAKGCAAHEVMLRLQHFAPVLVDAGGDIAISAPLSDGSAWPVGVANPFQENSDLELLALKKCGIATSGRDYRRWMFNHTWQHHIIDTRTNKPAETDVITSTVIADNVMVAEMHAKMGLVLGSADGVRWLDEQKGIDYLLALENGTLIQSQGFLNRRWSMQWNFMNQILTV